jgi:hypothetical protein
MCHGSNRLLPHWRHVNAALGGSMDACCRIFCSIAVQLLENEKAWKIMPLINGMCHRIILTHHFAFLNDEFFLDTEGYSFFFCFHRAFIDDDDDAGRELCRSSFFPSLFFLVLSVLFLVSAPSTWLTFDHGLHGCGLT